MPGDHEGNFTLSSKSQDETVDGRRTERAEKCMRERPYSSNVKSRQYGDVQEESWTGISRNTLRKKNKKLKIRNHGMTPLPLNKGGQRIGKKRIHFWEALREEKWD